MHARLHGRVSSARSGNGLGESEQAMPSKCILVILDGLGDRSYECFSRKTPLQAARTPVLDSLAIRGASGLYHAAAIGEALPSEIAHFLLFGYCMDDFPGRGVLEALGAGVPLNRQDVAVAAHVACVQESDGCLFLKKDKVKACEEEIRRVVDTIRTYTTDNNIHMSFARTKGSFGVLTLQGAVSPFFTDSNPMLDGSPLMEVLPFREYRDDPASITAANALRQYIVWAYRRLCDHPVNTARKKAGKPPLNGVVTQRAGRLKDVTSFTERYDLRGLTIASGAVYAGLAEYLGLDVNKVSDSGDPGHDITERLMTAREALRDYDFIHVHTKGPDEAAHTKNPWNKKQTIEALDSGIGRAIELFTNDPEVLLVVTADHATPSSGPLIHSGEPVPLTMCGSGVRVDGVQRFDEVSVAGGAIGCVRGGELMAMVLNCLDKTKLRGIMDTPVDQPYWPGKYEPFRIER